ncbi:MAG: transposase, partial [Elainellaceae cyanobacterium]
MESLKELKAFRNRAYSLLGNGRDGLFDLMDAVLTSRSLPSFAEVSLSPAFQRQWPSVYKSLSRAKPAGEELMGLYLEQLPQQEQLILAGDHT